MAAARDGLLIVGRWFGWHLVPGNQARRYLLFAFFYNAPELDRHLQDKCPEEFAAYKKRVKMLIPFLI